MAFEYRFSDNLEQTPDSIDRLESWFMDAKYGAFIHFGVYSTLEGEYQGKGADFRYSEWVQFSAKMPVEEYRKVARKFNPEQFDAKQWAKTFKDCGIKYVVLTSKHHDGFALFNSDVSDYNIVDHTEFKRDIVKELCEACHAEGLKFGVYYSHAQDWDEPDAPYLNNRTSLEELHPNLPPNFQQDMDSYLYRKSLPQVEELVKNYPLDLIWFDTPVGMDEEKAKLFSDMVRKHRPNCLINSRLIHRGKGVIDPKFLYLYDYCSIADKEVPTKKLPLYVESPDSVSSSFGYKTKGEHYYHTTEEMLHRLVHTVCAGGNSLINNGPMGNGLLDPEAVKIYQAMGEWLSSNREAIYGTRRNPFDNTPEWGDISVSKDGKTLYLHVFSWEQDIKVSNLNADVEAITLLSHDTALPFIQDKDKLIVKASSANEQPFITVLKVSLKNAISED